MGRPSRVHLENRPPSISEPTSNRKLLDMNAATLTSRLRIRPMRLDDAPAHFESRSDWNTMQWSSAPLETQISQTENWIQTKMLDNPAEIANYSIELLGTAPSADADGSGTQLLQRGNKVIGAVGAVKGPEVGYMISSSYQGKGYATEALRAFLDMYWQLVPRAPLAAPLKHTDMTSAGGDIAPPSPVVAGIAPGQSEPSDVALSRGWDYVEGVVDPENKASANVLIKCGFRLWSTTKDDYESVNLGTRSTAVYRLARPGTELGAPPGPFEIDMGPELT